MDSLLLLVSHNEKEGLLQTLSLLHHAGATLIIDDASDDDTYTAAAAYIKDHGLRHIRILQNPHKQHYGGNLKVGFRYAIEQKKTAVITAPASAGEGITGAQHLAEELAKTSDDTACVIALPSGFSPLSSPLTRCQNIVTGVKLSGWRSPYRAYRTAALTQIRFELNTGEAHFNVEVLLQLVQLHKRIAERRMPLPRFRTPGRRIRYLFNSLKTGLKFRLQRYNLFYDVRYHPDALETHAAQQHALEYNEKVQSTSPHSLVCRDPKLIPVGSRVLDIGCSRGYVGRLLATERRCEVVGIDILPRDQVAKELTEYHQLDLEHEPERVAEIAERGDFDVILMLDVLEHLSAPEFFLVRLYRRRYAKMPTFLFSTGNVAFIIVRAMLFMGYFNYGSKGILDITHKRLFSWRTFKNLLDQTGFVTRARYGFPLPYSELGFPRALCRLLEGLNKVLIALRPSLFSYQILFVAQPLMPPEAVLQQSLSEPAHR